MGGMQLAANGWWWMVDDGCTAIIRLPISIGVRKHLCMVLLPGARVSMELDILASASQSKGDMQVYAALSRYRPTSDSISAVLSSRKDVDVCMIARLPSYGLVLAIKGSIKRHPHDTAHSVCSLSVAPGPSKDRVQGGTGHIVGARQDEISSVAALSYRQTHSLALARQRQGFD
ncbi:hypothetical protein TgHK011_003736 [Trichoderma gracile]|nr:hypothetical protein TgHK011_003736 [Trichoderma gracile]